MVWYRDASEWRGCACWYSVCQPLTAFLEISACMLEIANLGVDLTTTRDSCDWDRTGVTCWVIMCVQSSWHVTDWWTIEGEKTIFWLITKLGKSVHRMIWEGPLALFRTLYKELSQCGIHLSSGVHHLFLKRDKFHSESASFTLAITCLPHISSSS